MIRSVNSLLLISVLGLTAFATAQTDVHLADSPAKELFHRSSWAHGYIHGYEAGFHTGNIDLHMARVVRDPHTAKEYKKAGKAYQSGFGNKVEFTKGYGSGFEVGYLDGYFGKEFRAASMANRLVSLVDDAPQLTEAQSQHLDAQLDTGYAQGRRLGLDDARARQGFNEAKAQCPATANTQQACGAFQVGFRWGYSDGYSNQRPDITTQRASK
jgi:hypothetical protein